MELGHLFLLHISIWCILQILGYLKKMFSGSLVSRVSLLHWFTKSSKSDVDFHNNELIWARVSPFHISAAATSLEVFVRRMESDRQLVNTNIWDLVLVLLKFNVLGDSWLTYPTRIMVKLPLQNRKLLCSRNTV